MEVCPTGAIIRTEFDTVVIQSDACNGCRDCIAACPFGVIDVNPVSGTAQKCTLCYDRMKVGLEPACAKACPTQSINFGPIADLKKMAQARLGQLEQGRREAGITSTAPTRRCSAGSTPLPARRQARGLRAAARSEAAFAKPPARPPSGPRWGRSRWRSWASSASGSAGPPGMSSTFFTASPHWRWLITAYFFLGGLAGGSYFVATMMHQLRRRDRIAGWSVSAISSRSRWSAFAGSCSPWISDGRSASGTCWSSPRPSGR